MATSEARKAAVERLDKAVWPAGGSAKVSVAATSPVEETVGGLPVAVTAVTPETTKTSRGAKASQKPAPSAGPAEVEVAVLPAKRAAAIGAGALMRVERTDAAAKAGKVRLSVDYSKFADAYGEKFDGKIPSANVAGGYATASLVGAERVARHGWSPAPEATFTTHGLVNGVGLAVEAWTQAGDAVVLFTPVYHAFARVIRAAGREVRELPLQRDGGRYVMDFAAYEALMTGRERGDPVLAP